MPDINVKDLEEFTGHTFENPGILEEARRRRMYKNDHPTEEMECMDPLATLGDAVLDNIVVMKLYEEGCRSKGKITQKKIEQVKHERTRAFAKNHNLGQFILWGKGEIKQMDSIKKGKAYDAVTEALIGAIFLDAQKSGENGLNIVQKFLEGHKFFESAGEKCQAGEF